MKTLQELCLASGNFPPERLQQLEEALIEDHKSDLPWYLRAIVGIGAWLASLFFLAFTITLIGWQDQHQQTIGTIGVVLLVVAVVVGRQPWGIFAGQCALAVSLAAQAMLYYGFVDEHYHPLGTIAVFSIVLAATLYVAFPNFLSRLITCFIALQVTLFWVYAGKDGNPFSTYRAGSDISGVPPLYLALHLATICWCFLKPRYSVLLAPLGYALIGSLAVWQIGNLFNIWTYATVITYNSGLVQWIVYHFSGGMIALTLFGVSIWAAGGFSVLKKNAPLFSIWAFALVALIVIGGGGILLALLFMLLGFSLQHRIILGMGLLLLPLFLSHYYYYLHLDLLAKSGVLIGSGLILLLLRTCVVRWAFADVKEPK